jgi:hypothetical protein
LRLTAINRSAKIIRIIVLCGDPSQWVVIPNGRENIVRAYRHAILCKLGSQHRQESFRLGHLTDKEILEIPLSKGMASVGKRIQELNLPEQALITTIRRDEKVSIVHGEAVQKEREVEKALTHQEVVYGLKQALERED